MPRLNNAADLIQSPELWRGRAGVFLGRVFLLTPSVSEDFRPDFQQRQQPFRQSGGQAGVDNELTDL